MAGVDDATKRPIDSVLYRPVRPVRPKGTDATTKSQEKPVASFDTVLQQQLQKAGAVRFSAHAQKRLEQAHIPFGAERIARLEEAVERAAGKGARESLVLMGDLALVVNIKNRTVVTAVNGERMRQNVFTNIDSAVITDS